MPETKTFEISWATLWRIGFFVLLIAVLYMGRQILLGLFFAIIISSGIEIVVNFFEKHGIPRTLGVILLFLFGLVLIILLIYTVIPLVIVDLNSIFSGFDKSTASVLWTSLVSLKTSQSVNALIGRLSAQFFSGNVSPLEVFTKTLGSFGLVLAVIVSSFYLSISRDGVERFIRAILPADYEKAALNIYARSRKRIGFWFQTQILLSLIIGVSVWGALVLLGVKHAFLLGIVAAIFEIVPFVGPIISGALAVLMALSASVSLALYTLIAFLFIQQFESHVLVPLLMRRAVGLHPVIVIISLLIGAEVGGIIGALIAVPAAAVFEEILDEWSSKKRPKELEPAI